MHTVLESYLETGKVSINKFHEPVSEVISDGLAEALELYDQAEEASGSSKAARILQILIQPSFTPNRKTNVRLLQVLI